MTQQILAEETEFFETHKEELAAKYPNQHLLVKGGEVIGAYSTQAEAIAEGTRRFDRGPFLVRLSGADQPVFSIPALALGILQSRTHANA